MILNARIYKTDKRIEKNQMYKIEDGQIVQFEEKQDDGTVDVARLSYDIREDQEGYFCHEFRHQFMPKRSHKAADVLALIIKTDKDAVKTTILDVKRNLKEDDEVFNLVEQLESTYMDAEVMIDRVCPGCRKIFDVGVISSSIDYERLHSQSEHYLKQYEEMTRAAGQSLAGKKMLATHGIDHSLKYRVIDGICKRQVIFSGGESFPLDVYIMKKTERGYESSIRIEYKNAI